MTNYSSCRTGRLLALMSSLMVTSVTVHAASVDANSASSSKGLYCFENRFGPALFKFVGPQTEKSAMDYARVAENGELLGYDRFKANEVVSFKKLNCTGCFEAVYQRGGASSSAGQYRITVNKYIPGADPKWEGSQTVRFHGDSNWYYGIQNLQCYLP